MEPPLTTSPLTLIIRELVHSQSQLEIKISLCNNMVLRHTFTSYFHQKINLKISLSLTSRMRTNRSPRRNFVIFRLSIQHQYSSWRELYLMMNISFGHCYFFPCCMHNCVGINKGIRNPGLSSYQKSNYDNQTEHRIPKRLLCY